MLTAYDDDHKRAHRSLGVLVGMNISILCDGSLIDFESFALRTRNLQDQPDGTVPYDTAVQTIFLATQPIELSGTQRLNVQCQRRSSAIVGKRRSLSRTKTFQITGKNIRKKND